MSDATDRIVAIKLVMDRVQPDAAPKLTQGEIDLEVDRAKLVSTWTVNTAYSLGAAIVPPTRNGQVYVSTTPGTSSAVAHAYTSWRDGFSEGGSDPRLTWEEVGTDVFNPGILGAERNIYDINRAARECWLMKARKASQIIDDGDVSFAQLRDNCLKEAEKFKPFARQIQLVRC